MYHRSLRIAALCLSTLLVVPWPTLGQQGPEEKQESIRLPATEVVVDVIVTDKKNRMVTDLAPTDFEVYENGVKQSVKWVRLIRRVEAAPPESEGKPRPAAPTPPASVSGGAPTVPRRPINLVALVFDNFSMSPESRVFARRAAREYIEQMPADDRQAIFGIDSRFFLVQSFTDDKKALEHALDQVTTGSSKQFASSTKAIERLLQTGSTGQGATPETRLAAAAAFQPRPAGTSGAYNLDQAIDAVLLNAFRSFEVFEREAQARATVVSLLALIRGLELLPGRKTVIFFSEGFALPRSAWPQFQSVMSAANLANVAIYTVDAGGLRVESEGQRISRELTAMAEAQVRGEAPDIVRGGETRIERAARVSRERASVLTELAASTGGLAIRNTNDLRSGLRRIDEDMRSYYLLTYAPANQNFDGRLRTIDVKVNRPGVKVRARKGYYALRIQDRSPIFAFEPPLFDLLARPSPPQDFRLGFGAFRFPTPGPAVKLALVAQIPGDSVSFTQVRTKEAGKKKKRKSGKKKTFVGDLGFMALVKDSRGIVVRKLSWDYRLSYSASQLAAFKKSYVLFQRAIDIAPGTYEVDIAARDAASGRASARRMPLTIHPQDVAGLRLSSIVVSKGGNPTSRQEQVEDNPFLYKQSVIMPDLNRTLSKLADRTMVFYFTAQTKPGAPVRADYRFLRAGQLLGKVPGGTQVADQQGRVQFVATLPLASLPQGTFNVQVTVTDGVHRTTEQTFFTVVN